MCKESLSWGGLKQNNERDFRQIREKRTQGNFKIRDTTFSNSRIRNKMIKTTTTTKGTTETNTAPNTLKTAYS